MLIFIFLIKNFVNNHYNISIVQNNTKRTTINSRLLAQTKNHNRHYHNDPELKEIIDKMNGEAIKKYQQTHDPYEQLKELVEKNGTKLTSGHGAEPMSTLKNDLLETYEETFGHKNDITLKSGMNLNDDDKSDKSSSCECTDINNRDLTKKKGKDKYLKHLKGRCARGICFCSVASLFLTFIGLITAKNAAFAAVTSSFNEASKICASSISVLHMFTHESVTAVLQSGNIAVGTTCTADLAGTISTAAMGVFEPCGIAALVLLILAVVLIILYIWLYRRRKRSWKHECKKHLCK
ncbi:hypothetical protein PFAG_05986 [Plasmodium falciparum Santa Lucia]|nr:hypothetical protein PFAG_05986 [Plasmodium falciparum Santa Lucia]